MPLSLIFNLCAVACAVMVRSRLMVFPTSWWVRGLAVPGAGWAAGAGSGGFRCAGGQGGVSGGCSETRGGPGPGSAGPAAAGLSQGRRRSAASGRARRSWVWAAMISQVQRSAACGVRIFGRVQPRVCLNSRKVCSRSKRRRNACHQRSTSARGGAGGRGPQPHRFRVTVAGQVLDLQPDQGAFDDRQLAVVVEPAAAVGQPRMDPVPAGGDRGAVAGGLGDRGVLRLGPGGGALQGELRAVLGRATDRAGQSGRLGQAQHPVASGSGRPARRADRPARRPAG